MIKTDDDLNMTVSWNNISLSGGNIMMLIFCIIFNNFTWVKEINKR